MKIITTYSIDKTLSIKIITLQPLHTALYCFFLRMDFVKNIIGDELKTFEKKFTDAVKAKRPPLTGS